MKLSDRLVCSIIIITLSSCGGRHDVPVEAAGAITDSLIRRAPTAPVVMGDQEREIRLNGKVEPDASRMAKVYALVSGKIQSVHAELGDYVHKGQVLAVLQSTEVAGLSSDLVAAQGNVALAKSNLRTTRELYQDKLATEQEYISARIAYSRAEAERHKAQQMSSITGGRNATYTITAPVSGYVIEKNITGNSAVRNDNSADLFAIADLSTVWIIASVYETDMSAIQPGDTVIVNTLAAPTRNYAGTIDKVYPVLDPATRAMKVRIMMNNTDGALKPEMFATVRVNGRKAGKTLMIPSNAIIMDNSRYYVVRIPSKGKPEVCAIGLISRGDSTAAVSGLTVGDRVVTDGQLFFYQALTKQ